MTEDRRLRLLASALQQETVGTTLERVCAATPRLMDVTAASVALLSSAGGGGVVTTAGPGAAAIFDLQFELGEGPCLEAFDSALEILVPDLATADRARWPMFTREAVAAGVAASFTFPLQVGAIRLGVLHLHRDHPGPLSTARATDARLLAEVMTTLMIDERAGLGRVDPARPEWPDQAIVHQATGMLAVQLGCELSMALARLRAYAFSTGTPLDAVARRVVTRELRIRP